jgi:cation diffusion facilitator family transporter
VRSSERPQSIGKIPHAVISMNEEKIQAASNSVLAAVGLTVTKITVGVMTGSLGILAEAAHSGLDLVAALMTYGAVKISDRPPDRTHRYGHGKVENLSALFETLLLLVTCVWIIYKAVQRLVLHTVEVEVTFWSFAVMVLSIVIDISRSNMLYKAAKKFNSQALEADALHFKTDIWSSGVVLLGLACVMLAERAPRLAILKESDAVAALGVAMIVISVSLRLGVRTIQALVDATPTGIEEKIVLAVEELPGVINCHHVRVRYSGPQVFADVHILADGNAPLVEVHSLSDTVECTIQRIIPHADVTVHAEPSDSSSSVISKTKT